MMDFKLLPNTFFLLQEDEEIGDVYQDEVNQAALLLYKDREDDALLMVIN